MATWLHTFAAKATYSAATSNQAKERFTSLLSPNRSYPVIPVRNGEILLLQD